MSVKSRLGRKAATSVAKHTVHGTVSKVKREPMRAARLITIGALVGALAGFFSGRATAKPALAAPPSSPPVPEPPAGPASPVAAEPGLEAVAPIMPPDAA